MEVIVEVKDIDEWEELMEGDDLKVSTIIVNTIIKNIKTKKRFTYILSVYVQDTDEMFDITLDKNYFLETLRDHLSIQEKNECFEACQSIINAIEFLEKLSSSLGKSK